MDWIAYTSNAMSFLKKYRYALLLVAAGILLLTLPSQESGADAATSQMTSQEAKPTLDQTLSRVLSMIEGAGKVEVLLTPATGEETIYQTDDTVSSGERSSDQRRDTVLITGEGRMETGLVRQVNPPIYQGAVIVCQGAGNPNVRLAVVQAVKSVTGLTSDRITVLKMK